MRVDHCIQIEEGIGIAQRLSVNLERSGIFTGRVHAYPDFDLEEPFILTTDWYALNFAGVLSQKQDCVELFLLAGAEIVTCMKDIILVQKVSC